MPLFRLAKVKGLISCLQRLERSSSTTGTWEEERPTHTSSLRWLYHELSALGETISPLHPTRFLLQLIRLHLCNGRALRSGRIGMSVGRICGYLHGNHPVLPLDETWQFSGKATVPWLWKRKEGPDFSISTKRKKVPAKQDLVSIQLTASLGCPCM